jgi:probable HAF family extracellular repeat protein
MRRHVVIAAAIALLAALLTGSGAGASARPGAITSLGTLGGNWSSATALNDLAQVVGVSDTASGIPHAFLWRNGRMIDLFAATPDDSSGAADINIWGDVVATSTGSDGSHGFLWRHGTLRSLDLTAASAINNLGHVVGIRSVADGVRGLLWRNGAMTDLGDLGGPYVSPSAIKSLR